MKRTHVAAAALAAVLAATPAHAQRNAENEALVRAVFDGPWSRGSFEGLERMLAPQLQFHYGGTSRAMSPERFQRMVIRWREALPDLQFSVEDLVSSGDRVAARFTFTGTHRGQLMDLAPTGRTVEVDMMGFFRVADGRITDMWEVFDESGMRAQLAPPKQ